MKPISLKFQAFGPYVIEQAINFNELSKAGLFLICGETGAGKTVILDAMTYALYGKSSGGGRGEITSMRCQLAPNDLNTEVEYIFEINNRQYKFTRTLKYGRKNINSSQNALVKNDDGIFEPFFENPKIRDVEEKAKELLGLDYEQFRQVIILPQGQFERLLVAKSSEKEEILVSLFGADKWQRIADIINSKINVERRKLDIEKANIDRCLLEKECQNLDELNDLSKNKAEELEIKNNDIKKVAGCLVTAKKEYEQKNVIFEKFNSFDKLKAKLDLLKQSSNDIEALQDKLEKSKKAETVKPLFDNLEVSALQLNQRKRQVEEASKSLKKSEESLGKAKEILEGLISSQSKIDEDKIRLSKLIDMTDIYNQIAEVKTSLELAEKEYNRAAKDVEKQVQAVQNLSNKKLELSKFENLLYTQYNEMFGSFIGNMSGILAQELKENESCPVCGSTEHPEPATILDTDITNEMLNDKKSEIEELRVSIQDKGTDLEKATESLNKQKDALNNAKINKEKLDVEFANLQKNVDSEIKDAVELKKAIAVFEGIISAYETDLQKAKENLEKIQANYNIYSANLSMLKKELEAANNSYTSLKGKFDKKIAELSFVSIDDFKDSLLSEQEKDDLNKNITDYKIECESAAKNIAELQKELANIERPDINELKDTLQTLEKNHLSSTAEIAVLSQDVKGLKDLSSSLAKQIEKFEEADRKCRENQIFARHLNGISGVSLQRYVLGVMLTSITTEANRLLENVHNGRYKLFRTLETTGGTRKAGLELEVFDSLCGERRSVVCLSGGEKFLVALSLSIGLSAVVQAQSGGIKLDAMFIDEGFGSLDASSIGDALMILSNIKNSNGLVGIISHVATLRENITTKIEVAKNNAGSNLSVYI